MKRQLLQLIQSTLMTVCMLSPLTHADADSYDDMMQAVKNDFSDDAEALLARGFDVNTIDEKGNTLLILSASNGANRVFNELMKYQPKLERRNLYGETALMLASYRKNIKMVIALLAQGAQVKTADNNWTALHYAASSGDVEIVEQLIQAGANPNALAPEGSSPLIMAAREGHIEVIRKLLALGANPDILNQNEMTALRWALKRDDTDIMELLVEANATR